MKRYAIVTEVIRWLNKFRDASTFKIDESGKDILITYTGDSVQSKIMILPTDDIPGKSSKKKE